MMLACILEETNAQVLVEQSVVHYQDEQIDWSLM